jgi:hypothetical protein
VLHDLVQRPYRGRVSLVVADVATVARAFGALRERGALDAYEPQAGDAACSQGPSGPHVSCVVSATWPPGARLVLECVDGGQGKRGDMAIECNVYLFDGRVSGPAMRSVENRSLDNPGPPRHLVWGVKLWQFVLATGLLEVS